MLVNATACFLWLFVAKYRSATVTGYDVDLGSYKLLVCYSYQQLYWITGVAFEAGNSTVGLQTLQKHNHSVGRCLLMVC